jgi:sulfur-oxidizing protein SoxZ
MSVPTKIRATASGNVTEVKILMSHPMETGLRKGSDGKPIPANFIRNVSVTIGGKTYLDAQFGVGVSKDPFLMFRARGARPGDKIVVAYEDSSGSTGTAEAVVR